MLSSECGQMALSFSPIEPRKTFQEETARPCLISGFTSRTRRGCGSCPVPHSPYPPSASTNNALPYCPIKCCPDSKLAYLFIEPRSSFSCGPSLVRSSTSPRRKGTSLSAPGGRGGHPEPVWRRLPEAPGADVSEGPLTRQRAHHHHSKQDEEKARQ